MIRVECLLGAFALVGAAGTYEPKFFPGGPDGVCHPLNVRRFDINHPACHQLYTTRHVNLAPGWPRAVWAHGRLAKEAWNCSTVQSCALGQLFLMLGAWTTPGFAGDASPQPPAADHFRARFWERLAFRVRKRRRRELLGPTLAELAQSGAREAADVDNRSPRLHPEIVTLGIHADVASAQGRWRGQLEIWKAYAAAHRLRWYLDTELYFNGSVFGRFFNMHWASSDSTRDNFWKNHGFLSPGESKYHPLYSFSEATCSDPNVLENLVVFTQPPQYWDSLEALRATMTLNAWTVWIDYDLTISPCCFDEFSFADLIAEDSGDDLPHVILRDSPKEDYSHHCANAGFVIVRNSPVGRLFIELAHQKRSWPALHYGYQGAMAESLLELLGLEWELRDDDVLGARNSRHNGVKEGYDSRCLPHLLLGSPTGYFHSYANYCACYRRELKRLIGKMGSPRRSRWVRFLEPKNEVEVGLLMASYYLYHGGIPGGGTRGLGGLPGTDWSRARHRSYVEAWLPPDESLGGACAMLPLVLHWASLPHRPRLLYDFLHARFPEELPLALLTNGSAEALGAAYRAAGRRGREQWQHFLAMAPGDRAKVSWASGSLEEHAARSACNLGSARVWEAGGVSRGGRSTTPYLDLPIRSDVVAGRKAAGK